MKRYVARWDKQMLAVALLCSVYVNDTFPARFHVRIAVMLKLVLWNTVQCRWDSSFQRFEASLFPQRHGKTAQELLDCQTLKVKVLRSFRKVRNHSPTDPASHPRRNFISCVVWLSFCPSWPH